MKTGFGDQFWAPKSRVSRGTAVVWVLRKGPLRSGTARVALPSGNRKNRVRTDFFVQNRNLAELWGPSWIHLGYLDPPRVPAGYPLGARLRAAGGGQQCLRIV